LPEPPPLTWTSVGSSPPVKKSTLGNGLEVWATGHGGALSVTTGIVSTGGWARGPAGAEDVWDMLVRYQTPVSFYDLSASLGMRAWTDIGSDHVLTANRAAWGNLDMSMWLQRDLLDAAVIEPSERQGPIDDWLSWSVELARWPALHTERLHGRHLFGGHRLGSTWWDRLAEARAIKAGDILGWHRATLRPDTAKLVAVGADVAAIEQSATKYLDGWKVKGSKTDDGVPPAPSPPDGRKVHALPWDSQFASLSLQCRLASADRPAALDVLREVLDLAMWEVMREGAGAYAPSAEVRALSDDAAVLELTVALHPSQGPSGVDAMLQIVELASTSIPAPLLAAAKRRAASQWSHEVHGSDGHFRRLVDAARRGGSARDVASYPEDVAAVTADHVSALLPSCVGKESVVVVSPDAAAVPGATAYDYRSEGAAWSRALTQ